MGPRDWFETLREAVERIGTTKDTGGSTTAGTLMGKLNAALSKANTISAATGRIGNSGDTGGTPTAGTVMGKLNAMLNIAKNGGMPVVKSVQYGECTHNVSGPTEKTITISPVNASKSIVILDAAHPASSGKQGCHLMELSETSLKIYIAYTGSFSWQVVESF